jgi:hypothetical protein
MAEALLREGGHQKGEGGDYDQSVICKELQQKLLERIRVSQHLLSLCRAFLKEFGYHFDCDAK